MTSKLSPEARRLIEASRGFDEASGEDRARVRARLTRQLAAGVGATALSGSVHALARKGWLRRVLESSVLPKATVGMVVAAGAVATAFSASQNAKTDFSASTERAAETSRSEREQSRSDVTAADGVELSVLAAPPPLPKPEVAGAGAGERSYAYSVTPPSGPLAPEAREAVPENRETASENREAAPETIAAEERAVAAPKVARATTKAPRPTGSRAATSAPGVRDRLAEELRLLSAARASMKHGNPNGALAELATYRTQFPTGSLAIEAAALEVDALCSAGRKQAAHAAADTFLERWPDSLLASRVRTACR